MLDGNSICLKLHNKIEPISAPKKWLEKYNEYEFNLYIVSIEDFKVENFNFSGPTTLTITQTDSSYKVKLEFANSCIAVCNAENITIANIKAYHNDGAI